MDRNIAETRLWRDTHLLVHRGPEIHLQCTNYVNLVIAWRKNELALIYIHENYYNMTNSIHCSRRMILIQTTAMNISLISFYIITLIKFTHRLIIFKNLNIGEHHNPRKIISGLLIKGIRIHEKYKCISDQNLLN